MYVQYSQFYWQCMYSIYSFTDYVQYLQFYWQCMYSIYSFTDNVCTVFIALLTMYVQYLQFYWLYAGADSGVCPPKIGKK